MVLDMDMVEVLSLGMGPGMVLVLDMVLDMVLELELLVCMVDMVCNIRKPFL